MPESEPPQQPQQPPRQPGAAAPRHPDTPGGTTPPRQPRPASGPAGQRHPEPQLAPARQQASEHAETLNGPRSLADRYRLESVIGKGAMGTVWVAYDDVVHRRVAIKEINLPHGLPAEQVTALADRTMREARAIGALSHPNVITLYDILIVDRRPYIVMELLQARSLAEVLKQDGPLPDRHAATIGVAVAGGLQAAHRANITHRDVKPGNVLIGHDGRVKLTDFGIARTSTDPSMTATGMLLGSPAYIAPEVASGEPASPAADAWGLGAMLFAAVEGRPPFDKRDAIPTLTAVVTEPVPPHPHAGRIGPVIDGLLQKDPRARMTIDHALRRLRDSADDPTGLNAELPVTGPTGAIHRAGEPFPSSRSAVGSGYGQHGTRPQPVSGAQRSAALQPGNHQPAGQRSQQSAAIRPTPAAMPPPPWAAGGASSLPALPATGGRPEQARHPAWLLPVAILVALLAAVAGYFLVQLVADWGGSSAAGPIPTAATALTTALLDAAELG